MAESFSKIYEATIGNTEFAPDNEHTLFTTNSTTTHVIKDIYVTNEDDTYGLSDGTFELNGVTVGTFDGSRASFSGHLIVPPNSTFKMKTTAYPMPVARTSGYWVDAGGRLYWSHHYENLKTGAYVSPSSLPSVGWLQEDDRWSNLTSITEYQNVTEANWGYHNSYGRILSYVTHDTNSSQSFRIVYANGSGSSSTSYIHNSSYNYLGFGLHSKFDKRSTALDEALWRIGYSDNTIFKHDIDANPATPTITQPTWPNWPTTNNNSPGTSSSYPRGHLFHQHLWWQPSSGYNNELYSKDILSGQFYRWQLGHSVTMSSSLLDFVVSIDWDNDKMYIYKQYDANTVFQYAFTGLWSNYNNVSWTYNTRLDVPSSALPYKQINLKTPLMTNGNMGGVQMGHRIDGGFTIFNNQYKLDHYDDTGRHLFTQETPKPISSNGTPRWAWVSRQHKTTASDLSSANISAPSTKVTVVGITST